MPLPPSPFDLDKENGFQECIRRTSTAILWHAFLLLKESFPRRRIHRCSKVPTGAIMSFVSDNPHTGVGARATLKRVEIVLEQGDVVVELCHVSQFIFYNGDH